MENDLSLNQKQPGVYTVYKALYYPKSIKVWNKLNRRNLRSTIYDVRILQTIKTKSSVL